LKLIRFSQQYLEFWCHKFEIFHISMRVNFFYTSIEFSNTLKDIDINIGFMLMHCVLNILFSIYNSWFFLNLQKVLPAKKLLHFTKKFAAWLSSFIIFTNFSHLGLVKIIQLPYLPNLFEKCAYFMNLYRISHEE
jgi:hypothetical protein